MHILLLSYGCSHNDTSDKLIDHYDELNVSMQNYFNEKDLPTFTGKYVEVKVKNIIKYNFNGKDTYIYDVIIAPIYNQKTVISGIRLSSVEYGKETDKFYYEPNDSYEKLKKGNYTYESIDQILANEYQFFLADYSEQYGYSLTAEQFESCLTNICMTVTINDYKDNVELTNLQVVDYSDEFADNEIIKIITKENILHSSIHAYVDIDWYGDK
ncbi:MAG: hypothetical protein Q4C64_04000 [Erysipelotrichia bacterium]|nr:hypothetical protein [Erysipelotrichia bacterium]